MSITEQIVENMKVLPKSKQIEVLDFVEYLRLKTGKDKEMEWMNLSISSAMRGMEDEESPYSISDLKETFS